MRFLSGNGMQASAEFKSTAHRVRTAAETRNRAARNANRQAIQARTAQRDALAADDPKRATIAIPARIEVPRFDPQARHRLFTASARGAR